MLQQTKIDLCKPSITDKIGRIILITNFQMEELIVYESPYSKTCADCQNGESIPEKIEKQERYICQVRYKFNNGTSCLMYQSKEDIKPNDCSENDEHWIGVSFTNH